LTWVHELKKIIKKGVLVAPGDSEWPEFQIYGSDRSSVSGGDPGAVLFPREEEEVLETVTFCCKNKISIVPSGGRTGYSGGAVARSGELVINLRYLDKILSINRFLPSITVQAGVITAAAQAEAKSAGFYYPVDFAASGSSMIGGNIATNAGGIHVVRYGQMREQIIGLRVVDGRGSLLEFQGGLVKNNSGYDLKQLFIGSEGTLGIILSAEVRLVSPPGNLITCLIQAESFERVLEMVSRARSSSLAVHALEFLDERSCLSVQDHLTLPSPFHAASPYYVLLEIESDGEDAHILETIAGKNESRVALSREQSALLWKYREGISESLGMLYRVYKFDVSLPLSSAERFIREVKSIFPGEFRYAVFGHLADGNIHLNILCPAGMKEQDFRAACGALEEKVYSLIRSCDGSISAEHGIGLLKKKFLGYSRSQAEILAMKEIKKVFDPAGIMNPGKVFE